MTTKRNIAIAIAAALGLGLAINAGVFAQGRGYGYGPGHMMGNYGSGYGPGSMMGNYGSGYGPGSMMGGYGSGYGPRHMMGGYGPGYGGGPMMRGTGPGNYGGQAQGTQAQGLGPISQLDLTDAQRQQVQQIQTQLREQHQALRDQVQTQYAKLRELNAADTPDRAAIDGVYDDIFKIERQFADTTLDARAKAEKILTDAQKQELGQWRRGNVTPPCLASQGQS